jgi:3-methyladenine DNA glycosylase/8-oxoguanine DNA glycosylase
MPEPILLKQVCVLTFRTSAPFDFRHTLWKPSHFPTELEVHTDSVSWRTFRLGDACFGIRFEMDGSRLMATIHCNQALGDAARTHLQRRIRHAYGVDEDLGPFIDLASRVDQMRDALAALNGMRQSCPENLFEISIISLLLQNATIHRSTQMMSNLLSNYGRIVQFDGVVLRAFFTPQEVMDVPEERFRTIDRLGYRAKYIARFAEFFADRSEALVLCPKLRSDFLEIKGVGPYTAAIVDSHASRDPSALGLDVWNRKILAQRLLGVADADPQDVQDVCSKLFPGYEGLAALYLVEHSYLERPMGPLISANGIGDWNAGVLATE